MKTTQNYFRMNGQRATGALERVNARNKYVWERIKQFESGDPYPLAYMVSNSTIKLLLQRQYTATLAEIKSNLYQCYIALQNGYPIPNDKSADVIAQAVLFLYENGGYYGDARKELRKWIAEQKNGWIDTDTVYYEDYNTGEIKRLPKALTCAIDGTASACTVSSYTVEEITSILGKIPLSPTERAYMLLYLAGTTYAEIAETAGVAVGTVATVIQTARAKAKLILK